MTRLEFLPVLGNWKLCKNISEINIEISSSLHFQPFSIEEWKFGFTDKFFFSLSLFFNKCLKVYLVFLLRLEASFAEHWLWKLPGQWSLPTHCLRHWWQAEREDGGWVSPYEEPVLWASGQLHGFHHVSAVRYQTVLAINVLMYLI